MSGPRSPLTGGWASPPTPHKIAQFPAEPQCAWCLENPLRFLRPVHTVRTQGQVNCPRFEPLPPKPPGSNPSWRDQSSDGAGVVDFPFKKRLLPLHCRIHTAHARRTARRTHSARPPRAAASSSAADSRYHARTMTHDDEKMLRAHEGTKPETPIDGVRRHRALAPAIGEAALFLPRERGSHRHTVVITSPRLSLAL